MLSAQQPVVFQPRKLAGLSTGFNVRAARAFLEAHNISIMSLQVQPGSSVLQDTAQPPGFTWLRFTLRFTLRLCYLIDGSEAALPP